MKTEGTPRSVGQYKVRRWTISAGQIPEQGNGITVTIQLGRNIGSVLLVTYLPTLLMNIINQATNYVNATDKYSIVITVNITSMMVLASVYLSVSSSLPTTASIKPVEIWLLFNLAYPFMFMIINFFIQVKFMIYLCILKDYQIF